MRHNSAADRFFDLIGMTPTMMPEAPAGVTGTDIDRRRLDEVHRCLRCDARAQMAFIANTDIGPRWLDLCAHCSRPLYENPVVPDGEVWEL